MNSQQSPSDGHRPVYIVLSPHSLPYSRLSIESLLRNSFEALHLHLITDSQADKILLTETMESLRPDARHRWKVVGESDLLDREATIFRNFSNLRNFRRGHPCWRKITDPLLLSESGEELILLDPDLYFPNLFQFEKTPLTGLLLMWQRPNCLLPPEVVRNAMGNDIPLADHVDIGVAHWRAGQDLDWIDWLIGKLGGASLPRVMHVEAIVWAAIAMHGGGGYLDSQRWVCWHRTQLNRVKLKLGISGVDILRSEPWDEMKCFHCGGRSKWWLPDLCATGLPRRGTDRLAPSRTLPFAEFTRAKFDRDQKVKNFLEKVGYYKLLDSY